MQKTKMLKIGKFQRLWKWLKQGIVRAQGFLASKWSFFLVLFVLVLFYIFPIDGAFYAYFPTVLNWSNDYYLTLWQVYGAIVGLSFVALFFSYEAFFSRVSSNYKNLEFRFRQEFYKQTFVQPLLFFNLFSLVYVGIVINTNSRQFQSLTLLAVSILTICFLFVKAISFFESEKMEKTRMMILQTEIASSIHAEVDRRLSTNLLLRLNDKNDYIKYELVSLEDKKRKPIRLDISERKRISDIEIDRITSKMKRLNSKFYFKKMIGEIVSPKYSIVGLVPENVDEKTVAMLKKCFKLKKEPARTDLYLAFDDIEEQLLAAVERRSSRDLARFLGIYYHSIEELLNTLSMYGIRYDAQQAKQVDLLNEWEPIYRIQDDFFHLVEISFETGNKEIIRCVVDFVQELLDLSKENDDFLIFYRFKDFWVTIFSLALDIQEKSLREFIIELLLRKLEGFISSHLLLQIEHSQVNEEQVKRYGDYALSIFLLYERMLKVALDKKSEAFFRIDKSLSEVTVNYDPENSRPYLVELEARLTYQTTLSEGEKKQLNEDLRIAKAKVQLRHDIDDLLLEIWLGVGGWITELYLKDKLDREEAAHFLKSIILHFKNYQSLGSSYAATNTLYPSFSHPWQFWELEDKPNGGVFGLRQEEWLTRFYCLAGISLTPTNINADDSISPTPNSDSNLAAVKRQCPDIVPNSAKWSSLMALISPDDLPLKTENFLKLHERAVEKQKTIDSKWLIEQPLDDEKVAKFKTEVINDWERRSEFRHIIRKFGNYVDEIVAPEEIKTAGLHTFGPKDSFVKQENKAYSFIHDFGMSLSIFENTSIKTKILTSGSKETVSMSVLNERMVDSIKRMVENGYNPNVILVGSHRIIRNFEKTKEFQPSWEKKIDDIRIPGFEGYFNHTPVFLLIDLHDDVACVLDLKKIGAFSQFRVKEGEPHEIHFDITFIDEKVARDLITKNPKLLENKEGKMRPEADVISELQERILVKIQERFDFSVADGNASSIFEIEPDGKNQK